MKWKLGKWHATPGGIVLEWERDGVVNQNLALALFERIGGWDWSAALPGPGAEESAFGGLTTFGDAMALGLAWLAERGHATTGET